MTFSHAWLPYIYFYGVGGLLFCSGLIITIKSGSLNLTLRGDSGGGG